ncbi:MAG TPA: TlpA disulfide reductase family protein [Stellaceae bacterium]|jgi:thiol-disulfide isomerase/thioredoxin|nr:TlpA disulfide reductase family protein [Stellaceae bacterium]
MKQWCPLVFALWLACATTAMAETKLGEFIPADPPQPAPEISVTDSDGKAVVLADLKGKLVLINLWATWCQPCIKEMPSLAALPKALGDGFVLLAVSEDHGGGKVVAPFVDKLGLDQLKVYLDPESKVGHAFNVRGLPTSIVIGPKGDVLGRVEGAAEWDQAKMLDPLKKLLPEDGGKKLPDTVKASSG